jgi:two-component system, OmpR family, sensor kinase
LPEELIVEQAEPETAPAPDAATTPRTWRFLPRTLAGRLAAGVVALVIAVVAISGALTYFELRPFLAQRLDSQLQPAADQQRAAISRCIDMASGSLNPSGTISCDLSNPYGFRSTQQTWVQVYDSSGNPMLLGVSSGLSLLEISPSTAQRVIKKQTGSIVVVSNGTQLRVTSRPIRGTSYFVATGLSTDPESGTLHRLLLLEIIIGGAAVIIAVVATAVGVRLSLRPLHRVTATAQAVTAELSPEGTGLERRVPVSAADSESEVGQLAASVNTLLGAVETQFAARVESEQRMRQFLADASHELRTPLTSIRGYAELSRMRRDSGRTDAGEDAETLGRIETEGNRMSRLVEDLLMLARGDQGNELHLGPVDMADVVEEAAVGARAAFPDRPIEVDVRTSAIVNGDHDQLLRVVRNLINNACVHTAPGGPVQLVVWREASVIVQVNDSGPGLPPDQAAHVFERFWRADSSRARSSGGNGLGLSIVASIVAAHGGTIHFDSDVTTGSTVTVVLPAP